jgi:hypothetical protein
MNDNIDDADDASTALVDINQSVALARAEIDQQVTTAHAFPRSPARAKKALLDMVQLDPESAQESMYAVPVDGKPITGPSIRFAEALKTSWGNCAVGARVTEVNRTEQFVEAEAVFWDLETNVRTTFRTRRSIRGKNGRTYGERLIVTTCGAASSIAMREAILKGIPKPVWRAGYEAVVTTIKGDVKTLSERRAKALTAFAQFGVSADKVFARLGVAGVEDIGLDDLPELIAMYQSIKSGDATVEDFFSPKGQQADVVKDPLNDHPDDGGKPRVVDNLEEQQRRRQAEENEKEAHAASEREAEQQANAAKEQALADAKKREDDEKARAAAETKKAAAPEKTETTAQESTQKAQDPPAAQEAAKAPATQDAPATAMPPPSDQDINAAEELGARHFRKGMGKKTNPYKDAAQARLAEAFVAGFDRAKVAEAEG